MKNILIIGLVATVLAGCSSFERDAMSVTQVKPVTKVKSDVATVGQIENVIGLPIRPGNVMATSDGRVFSTVHPNDGEQGVQLFEVTGTNSYQPWPSNKFQSPKGQYGEATIDTPLGITKDNQGGLWIVDMGQHIGKTRVWGFDIKTGALISKIDIPTDIAPKNSFVQDLVVDRKNGWIYLADIPNPAIIAINMNNNEIRRFGNHVALQPEADAKMVINGVDIMLGGQPTNNGINPITMSADNNTIYFGAMNGKSWYSLDATLFRAKASDEQIGNSIIRVGDKPVSDGATTDGHGNHYFTNLNDNGVDVLNNKGQLTSLVRDSRFDWPDNVSLDTNGWLYVAVNQLHKTPPFTGTVDKGQPPYHIYRVWVGKH